jgi:hypothetical protein
MSSPSRSVGSYHLQLQKTIASFDKGSRTTVKHGASMNHAKCRSCHTLEYEKKLVKKARGHVLSPLCLLVDLLLVS